MTSQFSPSCNDPAPSDSCERPGLICCQTLANSKVDVQVSKRAIATRPEPLTVPTAIFEVEKKQGNVYLAILGTAVSELLKASLSGGNEDIERAKPLAEGITKEVLDTLPLTPQSIKRPILDVNRAANLETTSSLTTTTVRSFEASSTEEPRQAVTVKATPSSQNFGNLTNETSGVPAQPSRTPLTGETAISTTPKWSTVGTVESTSGYVAYPCPGSCVSSYLSWFCDQQNPNYECPGGRVCCMPMTRGTTRVPEIGPCSGACLHPLLTGLCRRPAKLVLKTTTCDTNSICCSETPRIW